MQAQKLYSIVQFFTVCKETYMYMQINGYYHSKWVNEIILFHMHVCLFFFQYSPSGNFSLLGFIFIYSKNLFTANLLQPCQTDNFVKTEKPEGVHGLRDQNDLLQLLEAVHCKGDETSIYLSGKNTTDKKRNTEI